MKKINVSNLVLEEVIRINLFEDNKPLDLTDIDPKPKPKPKDDDNWDTNTWNPAVAKRVAEKLQSYKGSFFGGQDLPDAFAIFIIKNINTSKQWDDVDKEMKKLEGKPIFSFGRSFIDDDETTVWNKILTHVKKIYPEKIQTFVQYLGTDTYKQFLPKTLQSAKTIAQQIYDSKSWSGDNEEQLIASIQQIQNAALWTAVDKELQILTGEKGIFSYSRSFIRDNDTATWTPILTHIKKKRLVSEKMLTTYVNILGGPMIYPNLLSASDTEKDIENEIELIKKKDKEEGGASAIEWAFFGLGAAGMAANIFGGGLVALTMLGVLKRFAAKFKVNRSLSSGKIFISKEPGLIRRNILRFEEFITRGIFGNTGSLRRFIRTMERKGYMTAKEANDALKLIEQNRYAIASEIRKEYMKVALKEFRQAGGKTENLKQTILNGIPLKGKGGAELRREYAIILDKIIEIENQSRNVKKKTTPPVKPKTRTPRNQPYRRTKIGF